MLFRCLVFCVLNNVNAHQLCYVSLSTHFFDRMEHPEIGYSILSSCCLHNLHFLSISSLKMLFFKIIFTDCLVLSCHYCTFCFSLDVSKLSVTHQSFLILHPVPPALSYTNTQSSSHSAVQLVKDYNITATSSCRPITRTAQIFNLKIRRCRRDYKHSTYLYRY
jgi:hypothetical protein